MRILDALKGIGGDYELNRVVGFFGGVGYIVGAHAFLAWDIMVKGHQFDLTEYCIAFPGGLAVVAGGTAGAVAIKDRFVAQAKVTTAQADAAAAPVPQTVAP